MGWVRGWVALGGRSDQDRGRFLRFLSNALNTGMGEAVQIFGSEAISIMKIIGCART